MVVRILVGDPEPVPDWEDEFAGPGRPPVSDASLAELVGGEEWPFPTAAGVLDADALDPANIAETGAVPWSDAVAEIGSGDGGGGETTHYQVDFVAGEPIERLGEE